LDEGGMGVVYKAENLRLKRFVALKFVSPALLSSPNQLAQFQGATSDMLSDITRSGG
jgi:serine/threonine protein kinase